MIDIILLILLLSGIFIGLKRGFILQFFHIAGSIAAVIAALLLRERVAPLLKRWIPMPPVDEHSSFGFAAAGFESFYYGAIAFVLIFILVKVALSILGSFMNAIAQVPIVREANKVGGGVLGFVEVYLVLFVLVYLGMLLPAGFSSLVAGSAIADYMIHHTPYLSDALKNFDPMSQLNRFSF